MGMVFEGTNILEGILGMGKFLGLLGPLLGLNLLFVNFALADQEITNLPVYQHPFVAEYKDHLRTLNFSFDFVEVKEAVEFLKTMPTQQAYSVVYGRLERLPDQARVSEIPDLLKVMKEMLHLFEYMGSLRDVEMLKELSYWAEKDLKDKRVDKVLEHTMGKLSLKVDAQSVILKDLEVLNIELLNTDPDIQDGRSKTQRIKENKLILKHRQALRLVGDFYRDIRKEVIGQEEIVRSLETIYLKDVLKAGERITPEVMYLMGLPGNGKDTIAEAFTNAINRNKNAYKDKMFSMTIRTKEEAWTYFGSGKGYVGSGELPAFLKWLVQNSGGKYILVAEEDGKTERMTVHKNPDWKGPNSNTGPHKAVVFVNEAHDIPKQVKNDILKQAIEKGIFKITNPGSGANAVSQIELPVNFIFATNEGIDLLEPRERNGARIGRPLSFEALHQNWQDVHGDKQALKQAILKNNGQVNDVSRGDAPGTSEEFLNRIPLHHLHILEPLSPKQLISVARLMSAKEAAEYSRAKGNLGQYNFLITQEFYEFMTGYKYVPSENARPIAARLQSFVFGPFLEGLKNEKVRPSGTTQEVVVDVVKYENNARSTIFKITNPNTGEMYSFTRLVRESLHDIPKSPLSEERINELISMRTKMLQNVFGVEHIVDQLLEAAVVSESEARNSGVSARPATVMAFLGKSSTGKTETAKQYVKARYGAGANPAIIDFNGVRTVEAMEAKILGSYDANKNPIASEFMKKYDRAKGNITFVFDEAANSPKELLKALYEILREPVASGFSDGKARSMSNVTIILTGNAGEQIYDMVPKNLPKDVYERALAEVFQIFIRNPDMQHRLMLQTFPEALLARLGQNIFHFGPLDDAGKRQITQLKLMKGLKTLEPKRSERGWNVSFQSEKDLLNVFEMVERQGFNSREQGASIDKFVRESIVDKIKSNLLLADVESGKNVRIELLDKAIERNEKGTKFLFRQMKLHLENGKTVGFEIPVGQLQPHPQRSDVDRVLTAYHEAGHEITSRVFFGDIMSSKYLSIIEGVGLIGGHMTHYAGVRMGEYEKDFRWNKEIMLRHAAILAGGYVAQQLVTIGGRDDAGKSNDMYRATEMIQSGILAEGLSERWGTKTVPRGMSPADYIDKVLTPAERDLLNEITREWLTEAEKLAREALLVNYDHLFINMGKEIAIRGQLFEGEIAELYEKNAVVTEYDGDRYQEQLEKIREVMQEVDRGIERMGEKFHKKYTEKSFDMMEASRAYQEIVRSGQGLGQRFMSFRKNFWNELSANQKLAVGSRIAYHIRTEARDAHLASEYLMPNKVANIKRIIEAERAQAVEPVTEVEKFNIEEIIEAKPKAQKLRCASIFAA